MAKKQKCYGDICVNEDGGVDIRVSTKRCPPDMAAKVIENAIKKGNVRIIESHDDTGDEDAQEE